MERTSRGAEVYIVSSMLLEEFQSLAEQKPLFTENYFKQKECFKTDNNLGNLANTVFCHYFQWGRIGAFTGNASTAASGMDLRLSNA